jgi:RNA polymerase sigma factor (sigma-70 family)
MSTSTQKSGHGSDAWFVTTRWSVVLSAKDQATPQAEQALETLCQTYWYPLYAFVRRHGHSQADAQDLTQEFFARLLAKNYLQPVAREKGKFRTFLLVALKRFLADEWDRSRAQKRGGGKALLSLDTETAETRYRNESAEGLSPDKIYERRWALALIEQTLARLREEFVQVGKVADFECLKIFLTAEKGTIPYAEAGQKLGLSEGAARVAVHRLRQRFRKLFREEIAHTVGSAEEIEEELKHLMTALGN